MIAVVIVDVPVILHTYRMIAMADVTPEHADAGAACARALLHESVIQQGRIQFFTDVFTAKFN